MKDLAEALQFTLKWEGGYVDDPADAGGATNLGITQSTYNAWRAKHGLPAANVKDLDLATAKAIYEERYWKASRAAWLGWPLGLAVFDTAVNFGVARSTQFLHLALLGQPASLKWTQELSDAVHEANAKELALKICGLRVAYRHKRVAANRNQVKFLNGWLRRDADLTRLVEKG